MDDQSWVRFLLLHLLQNGDDHVETGPLTRVLVHADPDQSQLFISKANESEGVLSNLKLKGISL
jgi:hypothetical protein